MPKLHPFRRLSSCSPITWIRFTSWVTHSNNRSEEHTSELQSRLHLVCRLLLEKKKNHILTVKLALSMHFLWGYWGSVVILSIHILGDSRPHLHDLFV